MTRSRPRTLILTLFSGENEFEQSRAALRSQTYRHWEQRVYESMPNKPAHDALYSEVMDRSDEFDFFVKLDADMVFSSPDKLAAMLQLFAETPALDHAVFSLDDFMSDRKIMGMHVFSNRVRWELSRERLFVDPDPTISGERRLVRTPPAPVARHAPDPSPYQAFHFGVHRALKAFQPGRERANHEQAFKQWLVLKRVWRHFERSRDARLGLAILGADLVWRGELGPGSGDYEDAGMSRCFEQNAGRNAAELHAALSARWHPGLRRSLRWASTGGIQMFRGMIRSLRDPRSQDAPPRSLPD